MRAKVFFAAILFSVSTSYAEELKPILDKVNELAQAGNYSKALNELSWAKQELEKKNSEKLLTFFPDTLSDFKGGHPQMDGALGFISVERPYQKGTSQVKISLTGGASGGAAGLLGGIGQMAAAFGGMQGMGMQGMGNETVRIAGRTAQLEVNKESQSANLTVFLESGSFLKFETSDSADGAMLKAMAESFGVDKLDQYLRGNAG